MVVINTEKVILFSFFLKRKKAKTSINGEMDGEETIRLIDLRKLTKHFSPRTFYTFKSVIRFSYIRLF